MSKVLADLVESRISEALARGEFDNLPGQGKPLNLDDDTLVPEALRAAYRMLKNAGFAPPEVTALNEAAGLRAALVAACDELAASAPDRHPADARIKARQLQRRLIAVGIALDAHGVDLSAVAAGAYYRQLWSEAKSVS